MKPAPFELVRPATLADALHALSSYPDRDIRVLAGGQSLVPMMNFRVAQPDILIDLGRLAELDFVEDRGDVVAVGAMTRHSDVKAHPLISRFAPLVHAAYDHVAHATIRNRGTLGGNLAHADPASEMPAVMTALHANFVLRSKHDTRTIAVADFFFGPFTTALLPDELLVEILVPKAAADDRFAFEEVSLRKGDFAISAVAVRLRMEGTACTGAGIAIAGVSHVPVRAIEAEVALVGTAPGPAEIAAAAAAATDAIEFTGTATVSASYRRDLTRTLMVRALSRAVAAEGSGT